MTPTKIVTVLTRRQFSRYIFPLLSGLLLALSFPRPALFPLAWFAFLPLFFVIDDQNPLSAFLSGCLTGVVYFGGTLYWITLSLSQYGGLSWFFSALILFVFISYLALYVGVFAACLAGVTQGNQNKGLFFAPVFWVILEWGKGHFLTGFPWASVAYSQTEFLSMIQIADFGGIYVVAFVVVFCNRALYLIFRSFLRGERDEWNDFFQPLLFGGIVFFLSFFYGRYRLSEPIKVSNEMILSVIQGNIAQDKKWDRAFQQETLEGYQRLSRQVLEKTQKPSLIVWPESVLPFIFGTEAGYEEGLRSFVRDNDIHLLFGAPSMFMSSSGKLSLRNSAYLMSPHSERIAQYDKMHLVPFGEYIPFPELLFFIEKFVQGLADFSPGTKALVFDVGQARVGTAICFELIFPEVVRRFVENGATFMTTITNDAWFGRSSAPYQHFSMMVFRAIEHRIPFARAANTGISGFVDTRGRVISETTLFSEASATATLSLRGTTTLYTRFGDFFVAFCAMISLYFFCVTFINQRDKGRKKDAI